jgi:dephospho-CoA kinase
LRLRSRTSRLRPTRPSKKRPPKKLLKSSPKPPFVGLTGGIGAGKSEALAALERLGAATLSTDAVVHELYEDDAVRAAVLERFGTTDRSEIARAAFATEEGRKWLEELLWPRVGQRMWEWRQAEESRSPAPRALVVEVPLLFESEMEPAFDATVAVVADEAVRRERAGARGHAALDERTSRQLTQEEKAARATYTVANSGTIEDLEQTLAGVREKLNQP